MRCEAKGSAEDQQVKAGLPCMHREVQWAGREAEGKEGGVLKTGKGRERVN